MADRIAELRAEMLTRELARRRGATGAPASGPSLAERAAGAVEDVSKFTAGASVGLPFASPTVERFKALPPDTQDKLLRSIAPTTAMAAVPALLPAAVPAAGATLATRAGLLAARTGINALAGAAGQTVDEAQTAALDKKLPNPKEAGKRIASTAETSAALGLGVEAGLAAASGTAHMVRNAGRTLLDFLGNVKRGVAKTAGKLPTGAIEPVTTESIQKFGQEVADTVKARKATIGNKINAALAKADEARPEGVVPIQEVRAQIRALRKSLGASDPIPGAPANVIGPAKKVSGMTSKWMVRARKAAQAVEDELNKSLPGLKAQVEAAGQLDPAFADAAVGPASVKPKNAISLVEAKRLVDRVRDAIAEDASDPGAAKAATRRLAPFSKWLRGRISEKAPDASKALKEYEALINDSDAIESILRIRGGEQITPERITEIEKALPQFLRTGEVTDKVLSDIMERLGKPNLAAKGKGLAVANELQRDAPAASGEGGFMGLASRMARGVASPVVRPVFAPAARVLDTTRVPQGFQKPAGLLGAIMARKKQGESRGK